MMQHIEATASVTSSTADIDTFTPSFPVEIYEFGIVVTTSLTASDNLIIAADKRPTAGSDTGRGDGDIGTLTIAAADSDGVNAGDIIVCRPTTPVVLLPGEECVIEVTNATAAGGGFAFVNYRALPKRDASTLTAVTS